MYSGTHLYKFIHILFVELSPWTPMRGQMSSEMLILIHALASDRSSKVQNVHSHRYIKIGH